MKKYQVSGELSRFGVGLTLNLTEIQAATRQGKLRKTDKDQYLVIEPLEFKIGETIGVINGDISKFLIDKRILVESPPADAVAQADPLGDDSAAKMEAPALGEAEETTLGEKES